MGKKVNTSTLDKTNFIHFGFIFFVFLFLSFYAFDISDYEQRSFTFGLLCLLTAVYGFGSDRFNTFEFVKTTDYEPSGTFSFVCLCWWVALTDYYSPEEYVSKFTGLFLIFAFIGTFNLSFNFLHYFRGKDRKHVTPWFVLRPTLLFLIITLGAILFFFVFGTWSFHIGSPLDYISKFMRGY